MSQFFKVERIRRNATQADVAKELGWSKVRYNRLENGRITLKSMKYNDLETVANYFDISVQELIEKDGK